MIQRDWLYLPVVFIGVFIGIKVDGYFVPYVAGKAWMAFVLALGLGLARAMLLRFGRQPHAVRAHPGYRQ
jgi:hypothetical protein